MALFAGISALTWIALFALTVCICIAPLFIWRNTNRMSRQLGELINELKRANDLQERGRREGETGRQFHFSE